MKSHHQMLCEMIIWNETPTTNYQARWLTANDSKGVHSVWVCVCVERGHQLMLQQGKSIAFYTNGQQVKKKRRTSATSSVPRLPSAAGTCPAAAILFTPSWANPSLQVRTLLAHSYVTFSIVYNNLRPPRRHVFFLLFFFFPFFSFLLFLGHH